MIKPLIILFNTVSVFLFSFFMGDSPVTIKGEFPKNVKPGAEFAASVIVNKGSVAGFAKFQMEVPQGFTVKEVEIKGGSFSFQNNIAKIIWTSTPSDAEFTLKFNLTADATATGVKTITSKFSYINNNVKELVEMTPAEITIDGTSSQAVVSNAVITPTVAPEPVTTVVTATTETNQTPATTTETTSVAATSSTTNPNSVSVAAIPTTSRTDTTYFETPSLNDARISCRRSISKDAAENTYNVEVRIKKGEIRGFAKYQEVLPVGYTAVGGLTNGSSFSLSDGKAKFVWVSLGPEEEMVISYKLQKSSEAANDASLAGGEFSYLENDQSKKIKLPVEPIASSSYATLEHLPPTNTVTPINTQNENSLTTNEKQNGQNSTTENSSNVSNNNTSSESQVNSSISYLVQIGAFLNAIPADRLAKKFNVTEQIKSELSAGFSKFMVGNFNEYSGARSHRENMKQKGCASAFVVAYNGAKRITVQEALMITNQKWFK